MTKNLTKLKKLFGVVHCIAECTNCDWNSDNYMTANRLARNHAKSKKHKVSVEIGTSGFYDGR